MRAAISHRRRALLLTLSICCAPVQAQTIPFEFQSHPDCPVSFVDYTPSAFRAGSDRRQFVTVKNQSGKGTAEVIFQQTISRGANIDIVTLERISFIMRPGEKRRLSVSVGDVWARIQAAVKSDKTIGKPVLSVVAVEFLDGTLWSAPLDPAHK